MIKAFAALTCLALTVALLSNRARADDAWHAVPCGETPLQQPEGFTGAAICVSGPIVGADFGPSKQACSFRDYVMFNGRKPKSTDTSVPAAYFGARVSDNPSRCQIKISDDTAEKDAKSIAAGWVGGHDFMTHRTIDGGVALQFIAKDGTRCVSFEKRWQGLSSEIYGVYCDPAGAGSATPLFTDEEIKTRLGFARLKE